jgi:hypothetical protein
MTPSAQSSFDAARERVAHQHEVQRWQAAQTVRAHVAAGAGLASMLECLGLSDARRPEHG